MDINLSFERPESGPKSGPITIGWFLTSNKGAVLYDPPERVMFRPANRVHAKSASRCPAVIQLESRYFMIKCPFDIHLGFGRDDKGKAVLINRAGTASPIRGNKLGEVMTLVNETEWRYPDRPTDMAEMGPWTPDVAWALVRAGLPSSWELGYRRGLIFMALPCVSSRWLR